MLHISLWSLATSLPRSPNKNTSSCELPASHPVLCPPASPPTRPMQTAGRGAVCPSPCPVAGGCAGRPDAQFPPPGTMTPTGTQRPLADQTYAVPLIQPDLRREEAIQQVADALQHLQKVSGDIFSRWVLLPPSPDQGLLPALGSRLSNPRMHPLRAPLLVILGPEGDPAGFLVPKGPGWVPSF